MLDPALLDRWFSGEALPGVRFALNESVEIIAGAHAGSFGAVISPVAFDPEPRFLVELGSGLDVEVTQSELQPGGSTTHGFIGRPLDVQAVRLDFEAFVAELESRPSEKVHVVFGFAWGNEIYEHDWLELVLTGSELRARVEAAEAAGLGKVGADDLFIRLPLLGVERHYCHEADIHVTANSSNNPYLQAERRAWLERGWTVFPCGESAPGRVS